MQQTSKCYGTGIVLPQGETDRLSAIPHAATSRGISKPVMEPSLTVGLLPRRALTGGSDRTLSLPRGSSPTIKEGFVTKHSITNLAAKL